MTELPPWRLNLIRIAYAIMAGGIGLYVWPSLLSHRLEWPLMNGVVSSLLAGMSLFALLGRPDLSACCACAGGARRRSRPRRR